jgi:hypothetical protein
VSLQPHSADQIAQRADASQSVLDGAGGLVCADEGIPYFDDEAGGGRLNRSLFMAFPEAEGPLAIPVAQLAFVV